MPVASWPATVGGREVTVGVVLVEPREAAAARLSQLGLTDRDLYGRLPPGERDRLLGHHTVYARVYLPPQAVTEELARRGAEALRLRARLLSVEPAGGPLDGSVVGVLEVCGPRGSYLVFVDYCYEAGRLRWCLRQGGYGEYGALAATVTIAEPAGCARARVRLGGWRSLDPGAPARVWGTVRVIGFNRSVALPFSVTVSGGGARLEAGRQRELPGLAALAARAPAPPAPTAAAGRPAQAPQPRGAGAQLPRPPAPARRLARPVRARPPVAALA